MTFNTWRMRAKISTSFIALSLGIPEYIVASWDCGQPIEKNYGKLFKQTFKTDPKTFKRVK